MSRLPSNDLITRRSHVGTRCLCEDRPGKKSFEQRLQVFLTMDPERLLAAWIKSGGYEIRARVSDPEAFLKNRIPRLLR